MRRRLLLLIPVAIDMAWVYVNRPPGHAVNPFFLYLVFFGIGVFGLSLFLAPAAHSLRRRFGPAAAFLGLGFALSITEEVIAYLTRSGLFEDGKHALGPGLVQAALPLFLWTIGIYIILRRFGYSRTEFFLLAGLGGWMCEVVLNGLLFVAPTLAILALPVIAYSYFVLIYLPYRAVEADVRPRVRSFWRVPGILVIPAALWLVGGVSGHYLTLGVAK